MVPFLPIWEFVKGLLGEDVFKLLVRFGYYILEACLVGSSCSFCKPLRDCLGGFDLFQVLANESYKESVASVHIVRVGTSKAWRWFGLAGSWLVLWDLLNVHLPTRFRLRGTPRIACQIIDQAELVRNRAELRSIGTACIGV